MAISGGGLAQGKLMGVMVLARAAGVLLDFEHLLNDKAPLQRQTLRASMDQKGLLPAPERGRGGLLGKVQGPQSGVDSGDPVGECNWGTHTHTHALFFNIRAYDSDAAAQTAATVDILLTYY